MPCGGIYPIKGTWVEPLVASEPGMKKTLYCWQCQLSDPVPDHWCEEWDTALHGTCVEAFLKTEEGQCVLGHKHEVIVRLPGEEARVLHEEG